MKFFLNNKNKTNKMKYLIKHLNYPLLFDLFVIHKNLSTINCMCNIELPLYDRLRITGYK